MAATDDRDRDRGAEVGLGEHEPRRRARDEPDRAASSPSDRGRRPAREEGGHPERERELRELGRLERERAEREPALGAVHGRPDDEHGDEQDEADDEERPAERVAARGSQCASRSDERDEPDKRVERLPLQVVGGVVRAMTARAELAL